MTIFSKSSTGVQSPLGLDIELKLLVVGYRARADATHGGLNVLRLDRIDDVGGGQVQAGQLIGSHPGAHRVVLRAPQRRIADSGRALDPVEQVDGDVVGEEQRIVGVLGRVDGDHAEQRRRLLLDRNALALDLRRKAWKCHLDAVVDVDRVDVRIGAELERSGQRVAAVVAARALHVDHLVDAHDLGLDHLGDRGLRPRWNWRRGKWSSPTPAAARYRGIARTESHRAQAGRRSS